MSKTPDPSLISLSHCSVKLGEHWALRDISFELRANQRWVLLGNNGAGKSVFLKLLRGDMWPTPGKELRRYYFDGEFSDQPLGVKQHIALLTPERQDKYVRHDWNLRVTQVVTTGLFDENIPLTNATAKQQQQIERILKRCKLWSLRSRHFLSLSYGQRRRVLLARMLVSKPAILLLDEVFNGLDATQRTFLMHILQREKTWIVAAHSLNDIPTNATHIVCLQQGKLIEADVLTRARSKQLKSQLAESIKPVAMNLKNKTSIHFERGPNKKQVKAEALITLSNIQLYRDYRPVLREFDWTLHRNEHWAIIGTNGSGKSSLLMTLYGDLHPALGGNITRAGHSKGTPISKWKKRVALVSPELQAAHFQVGQVDTNTLEYIVASGRHASIGLTESISNAERRRAHQWLAFFNLQHLAQRKVREVSYGQLHLALLARAMVNQPELLLLDEPFTGLDPQWRAFMKEVIARLIDAGTQVVMAVHQQEDLLPKITNMLKIERGGKVMIREL